MMSLPRLSRFALTALLPAAALLHAAMSHADTLDDIKSRGKMIVAIDPTFAPLKGNPRFERLANGSV